MTISSISPPKSSPGNGVEVIRENLKTMPEQPGVYQMFDAKNNVLYVGKAKNLKKRLISYTHVNKLVYRISQMVMNTAKLEIIATKTEAEALILEANLIKEHKPKYNILLKDDKSFPYIMIDKEHDFPRISKHRGAKKKEAIYFGPFADTASVNQAISTLQKVFLLRPCSDNILKNALRPCMEYQIKRCSAPCVKKISKEEYAELVAQVENFLQGKDDQVKHYLTQQMLETSKAMDYEKAALYRDRIQALSIIHSQQHSNIKTFLDADILAVCQQENNSVVQIMFVRGGQILGSKAYFPTQTEGHSVADILEAFMVRFYQSNTPPPDIIISEDIYAKRLLEEILSENSDRKIKITFPKKGEKRTIIETVLENAKTSLRRNIQQATNERDLMEKLAKKFEIGSTIKRIDIFDNSHIFGKSAVGAMVVATQDGFDKHAYRKFNVDSGSKVTGGDDFYMMEQVLKRRYSKMEEGNRPDVIIIDGGAGHLTVAKQVLEDLGIDIPLLCIAKGPDRNAGREDYYLVGQEPFKLPKDDEVGYYLQRLRDEAHRFAISTHRAKRSKDTIKSELDTIPGIGASRKKALLHHFGSVKAIASSPEKELLKVEGVSKSIAKIIYNYFH